VRYRRGAARLRVRRRIVFQPQIKPFVAAAEHFVRNPHATDRASKKRYNGGLLRRDKGNELCVSPLHES
jgi:hypothetical protein